MKKALTIAGSDSGGGAGIQADLKSFSANGAFGMSVITALTAQNTLGVTGVYEIPTDFIEQQIDAVFADMGADAVKTGMLSSPEIVACVAKSLKKHGVENLVVDPVMVAKGGSPLLKDEAVETVKSELIPLAKVITPNIPEAEVLLGRRLEDAHLEDAAAELLELGCRSVILKGGHGEGEYSNDIYYDGENLVILKAERKSTKNTHGTGCTFASAVAAWLARGKGGPEAAAEAKSYITNAIAGADSLNIGSGHGPVDHFFMLERDK
ncbi:bifunctional hydroxymethylpyrimidine kinase/phosphomethylpyrimidine kinase [Limisalsivibrio acetivorans]|uniref:bifunctional hydroxymethylpyrimidine kinase/phosphomethylpyrimidine kinase n=1 Tax=Limisalsivibrio acetivorans TaxID=1304888 RepID=UPI0003B40CAE|nr:bifunctional hydroxymethylpyrimidine kinase/phosphomethylpyrimidine kinase [Limisalsivibrio acetivorans]